MSSREKEIADVARTLHELLDQLDESFAELKAILVPRPPDDGTKEKVVTR